MSEKKTKIVFVHNTLEIGGIERSLINLLDCIDYSKLDVDLVLTSFGETLINEINKHVNIYFYTNTIERKLAIGTRNENNLSNLLWMFVFKAYLKTFGKFRELPSLRRFFVKQLRNKHYDVLFALNQGFVHELSLDHINADKKYAYYHHGNIDEFDAYACFFERFDGIVTVSRGMQKLIALHYKELSTRIHVIHNILLHNRIIELSEAQVPEITKDDDYSILVSCGRLDPLKGFDLLIDAVDILQREGQHRLKLYVIGEGYERSKLEKQIKQCALQDTVFLLGQRRNPYPYMKLCDLYVQPSRVESYGISMAEAQVLGKVVLATRTIGALEVIEDGKNGVLCDMSADALAESIATLLAHECTLKRVREQIAKVDFSQQNSNSMLDFYKLIAR